VTARLAILSSEFDERTIPEMFAAIAAVGVRTTQFHFGNAFPDMGHDEAVHGGLIAFGDRLDEVDLDLVRDSARTSDVAIAAVDGTYNMIHPDPELRARGAAALRRVIEITPTLGAEFVALSTGTRNTESMWFPDPASAEPEAWADLVEAMTAAAAVAEANGVTLAFEPEMGNVVHSPQLARRLMDEVGSSRVKVLFDAANIYHHGELAQGAEILRIALDILGPDVVMAHAKDLDKDGAAGGLPAGHGRLDYPAFISLLAKHGFNGPIVLHAITPKVPRSRFPEVFAFVRSSAPAGYLE
jgi:sugar phosphate isomerase/epimerase